MIETDLTDLRFDNFSIDTEGLHVINLSFVNGKSFSIPFEKELPKTNQFKKTYNQLNQIPEHEFLELEKEVKDYLKFYDLKDLMNK